MGMNKLTTLRNTFWRFLFMLLCGLLIATIIPFAIMTFASTLGWATYANNSEIKANSLAPIIAAAPEVSEIEIPVGINYVLLNKSYQLLATSLDDNDLEQAMKYATTGVSNLNQSKQYLLITRENEYVVLQYYIGSQFTNDWLNSYFPSPEIIMFLMIGLNCIVVCIFLTTKFAKKMREQLSPLFKATSEVSKQNLDLDVGHSQIREFEDVLLSFSNMKDSLKKSLEQQWKAEQIQREQIAALAHDLKTPLTIIQGNADLIDETELNEEQRLYVKYIINSSEQMRLYIKVLIDISRATAGYQLNIEDVDLPSYLKQIETQIEALCHTKEITVKVVKTDLPISMKADKLLLERAIMNVVNNALDYSPPYGTICFSVTGNECSLQISITDEGKGFSQEALLHAHEQFYMVDRSRGSDLHFGIGLFITKSIMEQHGGKLILENSKDMGGAKVTLILPC